MAAATKIDPMHQFQIAPIGSQALEASPFHFTNSAQSMLIVLGAIVVFMWGGFRRQLVPAQPLNNEETIAHLHGVDPHHRQR